MSETTCQVARPGTYVNWCPTCELEAGHGGDHKKTASYAGRPLAFSWGYREPTADSLGFYYYEQRWLPLSAQETQP